MKAFKRWVCSLLLLPFLTNTFMPSALASNLPWMPQPGTQVALSQAFTPTHLWGLTIRPNEPFTFDFLVRDGDDNLSAIQKKAEYSKLMKYFLAALAVPDTDQWVNLSPYEKDRIIPDTFGNTEMGRDLLAQDYLLKQLSASLTNPESALGKKFWDSVYAQAQERFGSTDVPTDTFNKVWIMPDKAVIFEKDNTVFIQESHLKVLTEKDFLAMNQNSASDTPETNPVADIASAVLKNIIIPALEKEINEGQNFAPLRQVYSGMLLATWYKRTLKETLLGALYADQSKVAGIKQDPAINQKIYEQYVLAFQKGVINIIKEDLNPSSMEIMPKKYFSGGTLGYTQTPLDQGNDAAQQTLLAENVVKTTIVTGKMNDAAERPETDISDIANQLISLFTEEPTLKEKFAEANTAALILAPLSPEEISQVQQVMLTDLESIDWADSIKRRLQVLISNFNANKLQAIARNLVTYATATLEIATIDEKEQHTRQMLTIFSPDDISAIKTHATTIIIAIGQRYNANFDLIAFIDSFLETTDAAQKNEADIAAELVNSFSITTSISNEEQEEREANARRILASLSKDKITKVNRLVRQSIGTANNRFLLRLMEVIDQFQADKIDVLAGDLVSYAIMPHHSPEDITTRIDLMLTKTTAAEIELILSKVQSIITILGPIYTSQADLEALLTNTLNKKQKPQRNLQTIATYLVEVFSAETAQDPKNQQRLEEDLVATLALLSEKERSQVNALVRRQIGTQPTALLTRLMEKIDQFQKDKITTIAGSIVSYSTNAHLSNVDITAYVSKLLLTVTQEEIPVILSTTQSIITTLGTLYHSSVNVIEIINDQQATARHSIEETQPVLTPGGIDLAQSHLDLQIKRDGNGMILPLYQQDIHNMTLNGLVPIIVNIQPAINTPLFNK